MNGLAVAPAGDARPVVGRIRDALRRGRKLEFDYTDAQARGTHRIIWPVALGFFDGSEVIAGWCELRKAFRHFSLARIDRVEMLEEPLPKPHWTLLAEWSLTNTEVSF